MNMTPTDLLDPVDPLTPEEAVAERERLRDELARLKTIADKAAVRDREIKAEVEQIKTEQSQARMDAVRNGEQISQSKPREKLLDLEYETEEVAGMLEAAKVMGKKTESDLHYLHVQQFEAFAEHAERLGTEAVKALEDLRPEYEAAVRQWNVARSEWDVLVRAHNEGRRAGGGHHILPDGTVRTSDDAPPKLSQAPDCPLPAPGNVFGKVQPRPPEMKVDAD